MQDWLSTLSLAATHGWGCVVVGWGLDLYSYNLTQKFSFTLCLLFCHTTMKCIYDIINFYRAMHFSAKRGIAIACRLSVRPSVCLFVCLSVTLVNCDHIGWNSSKIISPLVSLGYSLFATPTWRVCSKGNTPKFWPKVTHPPLIWASETFDRKLRPNGYR